MTQDNWEDKDMKHAVDILGTIYSIGNLFLLGWIASLIWNWHIAPLGLPLISKRTAIGMAMFWLIIAHRPWHRALTTRERFTMMFNGLVADFACLGIAWIAQVTK